MNLIEEILHAIKEEEDRRVVLRTEEFRQIMAAIDKILIHNLIPPADILPMMASFMAGKGLTAKNFIAFSYLWSQVPDELLKEDSD